MTRKFEAGTKVDVSKFINHMRASGKGDRLNEAHFKFLLSPLWFMKMHGDSCVLYDEHSKQYEMHISWCKLESDFENFYDEHV